MKQRKVYDDVVEEIRARNDVRTCECDHTAVEDIRTLLVEIEQLQAMLNFDPCCKRVVYVRLCPTHDIHD